MHPYVHEYVRRLRLLTWNEREQRLRSYFRVTVFLFFYTAIFVSIPLLVAPSGGGLFRTTLLRVLLVYCTVVLVFEAGTYLDNRPVRAFGLEIDEQWLLDAVVGLVLGAALPTTAVALGLHGGWITVEQTEYALRRAHFLHFGLAVVVSVSIAVSEELVFRGYVLTNAVEGLDVRWVSRRAAEATACGASALLFALAHPAAGFTEGLHFLSTGVLLGFAYLFSGQLGLPIGLHAGFNVTSTYVVPIASDPAVAVVSLATTEPTWVAGHTGLVGTGLQVPVALAMVTYLYLRPGDSRSDGLVRPS